MFKRWRCAWLYTRGHVDGNTPLLQYSPLPMSRPRLMLVLNREYNNNNNPSAGELVHRDPSGGSSVQGKPLAIVGKTCTSAIYTGLRSSL